MVRPVEPMPIEEYFELEDASLERHEYIEGHVYALAGTSPRHNQIVLNIASAFRAASRGTACRVHALEVMLRISASRIYYPDVMVVCEPAEPTDRREKLFTYREIASLRAYYIVHLDAVKVEQHWLDESGTWWSGILAREAMLHIPCLDLDLPLADIYEGVTFDES